MPDKVTVVPIKPETWDIIEQRPDHKIQILVSHGDHGGYKITEANPILAVLPMFFLGRTERGGCSLLLSF